MVWRILLRSRQASNRNLPWRLLQAPLPPAWRGVELRSDMKLPQYFDHLTNNLVYRRIAPGLLVKLKERKQGLGSKSNKLNQWLSLDVGVPELLLHLGGVISTMKRHTDYDAFVKDLDTTAPSTRNVRGYLMTLKTGSPAKNLRGRGRTGNAGRMGWPPTSIPRHVIATALLGE